MQKQKKAEIKNQQKKQQDIFEETMKQLEQYDEGCEQRPRNFDSWGE